MNTVLDKEGDDRIVDALRHFGRAAAGAAGHLASEQS
jgi:hypothetical protein